MHRKETRLYTAKNVITAKWYNSKEKVQFIEKNMTRTTKKIVYGIGYLAFFILVVGGVFSIFSGSEETCSDGIQNQGEEGIDCGGPCEPCDVLTLKELHTSSYVSVFPSGEQEIVLLGQVTNPNETHTAKRFSYTFEIYDGEGNVIEEEKGIDSVPALGRRYLFNAGVRVPYSDTGKVSLKIEDTSWEKAIAGATPALVTNGVETKVENDQIRVSGTVQNQSSFIARDIRVVAVLFDKYGIEVFASQTLISSIWGFEEGEFAVLFPRNEDIIESADPLRTEIFVSGL